MNDAEGADDSLKLARLGGIVISDPIGALAHLQLGRAFTLSGDKTKQARKSAAAAARFGDQQHAIDTRFLKKVGTFDAAAKNEIRATGAPPLGADGFNPPSLLGAFALGPYLHNGSALTFDNVLENVTHRSAGNRGIDILTDARDRAALVTFLKSIDSSTPPFAIR